VRIEIGRNADGTWFALLPGVPGCTGEGDTPRDAIANVIQRAMEDFDLSVDEGAEIELASAHH